MSLSPSCIFGLQDTDDLEAKTIEPDAFTQSVASGEELFFGFRPDYHNPRVLDLVFGVIEASLRQFQHADGRQRWCYCRSH